MDKGKTNVVAAGNELDKATEYSKSSRKWICAILIIVVLVVIVLVLILTHK